MVCRGRHNHELVLEMKDIVVAGGALNSEVLLLRGLDFAVPKGQVKVSLYSDTHEAGVLADIITTDISLGRFGVNEEQVQYEQPTK